LSVLAGELIGFSYLMQKIEVSGETVALLLIMAAVISILGKVIHSLAELPIDSALAASSGLSVLLLALSASMAIIGKAGIIEPTVLITLGIMVAVTALLAAIIGTLASMDIDSTLETAASLSVLLLSLSASCLILSSVGAVGSVAFIGIGALAALIVALGALMVGIGALMDYVPELEGFLNKGIAILEKIGYGLGSFFGNIASGFAVESTSGLPEIGLNLSAFMENAKPFIECAKEIDAESMNAVKALAQAILILTATDIIEGLTSWFTGGSSFEKFGEELAAFGIYFKEYSDNVAGIDSEIVTASSAAALTLSKFAAAIPNDGGLVSLFTGDNKLAVFGEQLAAFGIYFKEYSDNISGINPDVVTASSAAAQTLLEFAQDLPNSGGLISLFTGDNKLDTFGKQLAAFGKHFKEYSDNISGINLDVVTASSAAAQALFEFAQDIPNSGGLISLFAGENNLVEFGKQLAEFGKYFKKYGENIDGLKPDVAAASAKAAKAVAAFADSVPNSGGLVSLFTGENGLDKFGKQLAEFGKYFKEYGESISGLDSKAVVNSSTAAKAIAAFADTVPNSGGLASLFAGDNTLAGFGKNLSEFGKYFKEYCDTVSGIEIADNSAVIAEIKALAEMAKGLEKLDTKSMSGFGKALTELGNIGVDGFIQAFTDANSRVAETADNMLTTFISAAEAKQSALTTMSEALVQTVINTLNSKYSDFQNAGKYVVQGFADGISENTYLAVAKAKAMAEAADEAAKEALDINSPSKVFISTGKNVAEGFAEGIEESASIPVLSAENMAEKTTKSVDNMPKKFNSIGKSANKSLAQGVRSNEMIPVNAVKNTINKMTNAVNTEARAFTAISNKIGENLADCIRNSTWQEVYGNPEKAERVAGAASLALDNVKKWIETEKAFDNLSIAEELEIWTAALPVYAAGTEERLEIDKNMYSLLKEMASQHHQDFTGMLDREEFYGRMNTERKLALYREEISKYKEGSDEYKEMVREIYTLENQLAEESYQHSMNWIDKEKEAGRLSLADELAAYERVQARYKQGSEEFIEMERKKYETRNEIISASYQNSMNWISREKEYNRMGTAGELAAYSRVRTQLEEAYRRADELGLDRTQITGWLNDTKSKVYSLQKEIYTTHKKYESDLADIRKEDAAKRIEYEEEYRDKCSEVNEQLKQDIKDLDDAYADAVESRAQSLYDSYGLFDEVAKKDDVSASVLMQNLQGQVDEFEDWREQLDLLSAKGLNSDLIESLPTEQSTLNKAKENAVSLITSATRGYVTITKNEEGSQAMVISSRPAKDAYNPVDDTWERKTKLWMWNMGGLAYFENGYPPEDNAEVPVAITMNGEIVADFIRAGTLTAITIEAVNHNSKWNLNTGEFTMVNGSISLGEGVAREYSFQVTDEGEIYAELGNIGGFTIGEHPTHADTMCIYNDVMNLNSYGLEFYIDGDDLLGTYGTQYWTKDENCKGLTVSLEHDTAYIAWVYKEHASDDDYEIKFMYTSKPLMRDDGGEFKADRLHLGTYLQLDNYGFEYTYRNIEYHSISYLENSKKTQPISFVTGISVSGNTINYKTLDCYVCNGVLMDKKK